MESSIGRLLFKPQVRLSLLEGKADRYLKLVIVEGSLAGSTLVAEELVVGLDGHRRDRQERHADSGVVTVKSAAGLAGVYGAAVLGVELLVAGKKYRISISQFPLFPCLGQRMPGPLDPVTGHVPADLGIQQFGMVLIDMHVLSCQLEIAQSVPSVKSRNRGVCRLAAAGRRIARIE